MFFTDLPNVDLVVRSLVLGPLGLLWIVALARFNGLRTFSEMTTFDFVATVATGSLLAQTAAASDWSTFIQSAIGVAAILGVQIIIALCRLNSPLAIRIVERKPRLLFYEGEWYDRRMRKARITRDDVWAKIREANCLDLSQLRAVVLETTGDLSIMHGDQLSKEVLAGTKGMVDPEG